MTGARPPSAPWRMSNPRRSWRHLVAKEQVITIRHAPRRPWFGLRFRARWVHLTPGQTIRASEPFAEQQVAAILSPSLLSGYPFTRSQLRPSDPSWRAGYHIRAENWRHPNDCRVICSGVPLNSPPHASPFCNLESSARRNLSPCTPSAERRVHLLRRPSSRSPPSAKKRLTQVVG